MAIMRFLDVLLLATAFMSVTIAWSSADDDTAEHNHVALERLLAVG